MAAPSRGHPRRFVPAAAWLAGTGRRRSVVADGDHDKTGLAERKLDFELVVDALAQYRARQRRVHADPAVPGVGFVRADDPVADYFATVRVLQFEARAEVDRRGIGRLYL